MRSCTIALALSLLFARTPRLAAQAQAPSPSRAADRQLFRLEDQWATALVKRDADFFRRTLHPDYVYSDERGVFGKEQVIAQQVGGTDTVEYAGNEQMKAHVHGSEGVVTGILIVRGRGKAGPFTHRYRYTDTWLRDSKRWLMIASQDYEIPAR